METRKEGMKEKERQEKKKKRQEKERESMRKIEREEEKKAKYTGKTSFFLKLFFLSLGVLGKEQQQEQQE